ncbi:MAG: extracellular solute-binding protein, partial [Treponema sp.]|nr:extracellular solute-binding protein [Treponema sp.]
MTTMKKRSVSGILAVLVLLVSAQTALFAGGKQEAARPAKAPVTILVAAAASLRNAYEQELIPRFQAAYPWITVEGTYDSSGKLQTQIEQGLEADVFMSAATTQMNNLVKGGFVAEQSVRPLLENKVVLIKPVGISTAVTGFRDITAAPVIA